MTSSTKRKHVRAEVLQSELRVPAEGQEVVQVLSGRGNNLHDVVSADGQSFLVSMPTKFRRSVWVKRGNFVIVERIPEGDKVKAEIVTVLTKDHIRFLKNQGCWPDKFNEDKEQTVSEKPSFSSSSSSSSESEES